MPLTLTLIYFRIKALGRELAPQGGQQVLGCHEGHIGAGLPGGAGDMGADNSIVKFGKAWSQLRFIFEYIQAGAPDLLFLQGFDQGFFIYYRPAGSVDQDSGPFHQF